MIFVIETSPNDYDFSDYYARAIGKIEEDDYVMLRDEGLIKKVHHIHLDKWRRKR